MKNIFLVYFSIFVLFLFLAPSASASICTGYETALVPCGQELYCTCTLNDVPILILRIFNFLVWQLSAPLAGLVVTVGGVMLMVSGGNPSLASKARDMIKYSAVAILLIFGSWLITHSIMWALGFQSSFIL